MCARRDPFCPSQGAATHPGAVCPHFLRMPLQNWNLSRKPWMKDLMKAGRDHDLEPYQVLLTMSRAFREYVTIPNTPSCQIYIVY